MILSSLFDSRISEFKSMPGPLALYFLCVYYLEKHRERRSVDYAVLYLMDDRNCEHLDTLEKIARLVVDDNLFSYEGSPGAETIAAVEIECRSLLVYAAHYRVRVRKFCRALIERLVAGYPQILWNKSLVHLMIDLLRYLDCEDADIRKKMVRCKTCYLIACC